MSLKKANEKAVQADEWEGGGGGGVCSVYSLTGIFSNQKLGLLYHVIKFY